MGHLAKVENGIVTEVIVCDSIEWAETNKGGTWITTSYNTRGGVHANGGTPIHKNYAGIGYSWDGTGFAAPQPYPSWTLNQDTYLWEAPVAMPTDGKIYVWNETAKAWEEVTI